MALIIWDAGAGEIFELLSKLQFMALEKVGNVIVLQYEFYVDSGILAVDICESLPPFSSTYLSSSF